MHHLLNILAGVGQALGALGTAPQYRYPELGDRQKDMQHIVGDMAVVGRRLGKQTDKELKKTEHGEIDHCTATQ